MKTTLSSAFVIILMVAAQCSVALAYQLETRQRNDGTLVTTLKPTPLTNDRGAAFLIGGIVVFFISYFAMKLIFQGNCTRGFWDHETGMDFAITGASIALGVGTVAWLWSIV